MTFSQKGEACCEISASFWPFLEFCEAESHLSGHEAKLDNHLTDGSAMVVAHQSTSSTFTLEQAVHSVYFGT